jgi:hypothetical protein
MLTCAMLNCFFCFILYLTENIGDYTVFFGLSLDLTENPYCDTSGVNTV